MSSQRIFAFWTGDNEMPEVRRQCFETFGITGLDPTLVTTDNLSEWIVPDHPLHEAYEFLSSVHRSDYLRAYFMYYHGGGYADIKHQTGSWLPAIERVKRSHFLIGAGYREIRGGTVWLQGNRVDGRAYLLSLPVPTIAAKLATNIMRAARPLLIGNGAFYFRPGTTHGRRWLCEVERRLDLLLPKLLAHPASHPRDRLGDPSGYPVPWSFLLGDVAGPLGALFFPLILRDLPRPRFTDYL
jgi:hypothetical protein